jgi:AbrB family looped-hinge helix DNA binding protein
LTESRNFRTLANMTEKITIGRRGAITIPAKMRKKYGLEQNGELLAETTDQGILLRPAVSIPIEMYTEERIAEFAEEDELVGEILDHMEN